MGLWYLKDTGMSLTAYADADHAGCQDTRRSTSGSTQFLGDKLVSWSSKKQKSTAISNSSVPRQQKFNCSMLQQRSTLKSKVHRCTLPLYNGAGEEWNSGTVLYLDRISTGCHLYQTLAKRKIQFLDQEARCEKHVSENAKTSNRGRGQVKMVTRVKLKRNALIENKKNLEKAEKERDELKLTLEKFQNSSKSLNNLLESQVVDKFKTGLGYNAASSTAASPAVESFVNTSEMLENQEHNKSKSDKGYHAVPPPFTMNFIPFKPDLDPAGVKVMVMQQPKTGRENSFRPPLRELKD
ncbi:putative ribonuclease H-like domain-containing protein [Tanacetum coccineum]